VARTLETNNASIFLWSDSTVTLGWIKAHPVTWKTYVANRVSEIQTSLPGAHWLHVSSRDNPADCASRGLAPRELVKFSLWWNGPPWLWVDGERWTTPADDAIADGLPERRIRAHVAVPAEEKSIDPDLLTRYSHLNRLLRITAWRRRWLPRQRASQRCIYRPSGHLAPSVLRVVELEEARLQWIRQIQAAHFRRELAAIKQGGVLSVRGPLTKLNPVLDENGVLRVGERLRNAPVQYDTKHPIILPGASHFTRLIIEDFHRRTLHGGVQLTLGAIRQEFWIPRGRSLVKSHIHRCVTCLRWRAANPQPLMGDLPASRVTPARAFLSAGVDYAGPVWLRTSKGRGHRATKGFIAVFVCLCTRAVHLDVASDYSADAFLAVLRRFVARRGLCRDLYSDCGTNFVGADAQLRELFTQASKEGQQVATRLAEDRIQWHFNPPAAPNFGGIWEAEVKSAKHHLRRTIGESTLTFEEMVTLLSQVEACLNSSTPSLDG